MSGFKFSPPALEGLPVQPLGDKTLKDLVSTEVGYDGGTEFDRITFTFEAGVNGLIRAAAVSSARPRHRRGAGHAPARRLQRHRSSVHAST